MLRVRAGTESGFCPGKLYRLGITWGLPADHSPAFLEALYCRGPRGTERSEYDA